MSSKSGAKDDGAVMVTEENKSGGQKAAEAEVEGFRRKLGPFVVAAETTRMPMVFTDAEEPDHPIIFLFTHLPQPISAVKHSYPQT